MDFEFQTNIICSCFLVKSFGDCINKECDLPNHLNKLSFIVDGERIISSLLKLTENFDHRFSNSPDLEVILADLGSGDYQFDVSRLIHFYLGVLDNLFEKKNWGRIASMFGFLRVLVCNMMKIKHNDAIIMLIKATSVYCKDKLKYWICDHGGWVSV